VTTSEIQSQITAAALQNGVPPSLALAVAKRESSFNPNAVSPPNKNGTQDYGLFQINSSNLATFGVVDPLDPTQNIQAGTQLLGQLLRQYNGDQVKALAAYNAGSTAVDSGRIPPSTQAYVASVLSNQGQFADFSSPASVPDGSVLVDSSIPADTSVTQASLFGSVQIFGTDIPLPLAAAGVGLGVFLLAKLFGD
jgi:hypothetical protein